MIEFEHILMNAQWYSCHEYFLFSVKGFSSHTLFNLHTFSKLDSLLCIFSNWCFMPETRCNVYFKGEPGSRKVTILFSLFRNWWPMFVLIFYVLVPVPTIISRRMSNSFDSASSACMELCIFLTTGIVVSCMSLPIILARASVVSIHGYIYGNPCLFFYNLFLAVSSLKSKVLWFFINLWVIVWVAIRCLLQLSFLWSHNYFSWFEFKYALFGHFK